VGWAFGDEQFMRDERHGFTGWGGGEGVSRAAVRWEEGV